MGMVKSTWPKTASTTSWRWPRSWPSKVSPPTLRNPVDQILMQTQNKKKAVAKRKSVPQSSSAPVQIPVQAKKPKTDDDVEGIIEDVDVKGIKAEPEPSGSGVSAPNVNPMVEAELDDSYHGGGADDDNGDFGGGEEFEGFDQYGDGNEFDDSLGAAGASASAGADGKDLTPKEIIDSYIEKIHSG